MRIVGYIDHPRLKITVFQMDNRYSVKLETAHLEQTYKFRIGDRLETLEDVRQFVNPAFLAQVERQFQAMAKAQLIRLNELTADADDDFAEIL